MLNSKTIKVSIIIVNYNTFGLTSRCIQSIMHFVNDLAYEIILVDNNSTDTDPNAFTEQFPFVRLIKSQTNLGFAKGNNVGIAAASGDYILLLNSDTELVHDAVSVVYQFLETHRNIAVASARLEYPNGTVQHNCQRFPSIRVKLFELFRLQKLFPKTGSRILLGSFFGHHEIIYPDWVWGTFFMFKKELLQRLPNNKLADDFFMYVEDMQWCFEFRKLGLEIAFVPQAKVIHHMSASGGKKSALMQQNLVFFMRQYYSSIHRTCIELVNLLLTGKYGA